MNLAEEIDKVYQMRENRLMLQKQIDVLEQEEKDLKKAIMAALKDVQATGHAGQLAQANLKLKSVAKPEWETLYAHIKATGEFELLHKRIADGACRERWEAGLTIPGVTRLDVEELSITKV